MRCALYQLFHEYKDESALRGFLSDLHSRVEREGNGPILFHIFVDQCDPALVEDVTSVLRDVIPDAFYVAASTNGNVVLGEYPHEHSINITITCDVFEDPSAALEIVQLPLDYDIQDETVSELLSIVEGRPWVHAIEALSTIIDADIPGFCGEASSLPEDIVWFGGCAMSSVSPDLYTSRPFICSSAGGISNNAVAFILYGGDNLHVLTQASVGWKSLGAPMQVTSANRSEIYELDGKPAYDVYYHYLKINNDENFFASSVLFPLAFDWNGFTILKTPVQANEDHSLTVTSDLSDRHSACRIAYGDPAVILRDIEENARKMKDFGPQVIRAFSCAGRKVYWGDDHIRRETVPFNFIAPTFGFYTGGEFYRYKGEILHLNDTLVTVGLREGDTPPNDCRYPIVDIHEFSRQMALIHSLTSFIGHTSEELESAYLKMEQIAITDGLTGLLNRSEVERRIEQAIEDHKKGELRSLPIAIMVDIDDFKKINDRYGHKAGDEVLRSISALFEECVSEFKLDASVGRWGGEEFMILLKECSIDSAHKFAEEVRVRFSQAHTGYHAHSTASLGIVQAKPDEDPDSFCIRVDNALYSAKALGKNRVIIG